MRPIGTDEEWAARAAAGEPTLGFCAPCNGEQHLKWGKNCLSCGKPVKPIKPKRES